MNPNLGDLLKAKLQTLNCADDKIINVPTVRTTYTTYTLPYYIVNACNRFVELNDLLQAIKLVRAYLNRDANTVYLAEAKRIVEFMYDEYKRNQQAQ